MGQLGHVQEATAALQKAIEVSPEPFQFFGMRRPAHHWFAAALFWLGAATLLAAKAAKLIATASFVMFDLLYVGFATANVVACMLPRIGASIQM